MRGLGNSAENKTTVINQAVLDCVVEAIVEGDSRSIQSLGIPTEVVDMIQNLSAPEIRKLVKGFGSQFVDISINPHALRMFNEHVLQEADHERVIDRAMRAGARFSMMNALTGMTRHDYERRRELLEIQSPGRGRMENLTEDDEQLVWRAWRACADEPNLLMRCCLVADETASRVDQVWLAVRQYVEDGVA